jgi:thiosulfate dehydrogenase
MRYLIGIILGVILTGGVILAYFLLGYAPAAVADHPMPFEKAIANRSLDAHIARQPTKDSPVPADEADLVSGAYLYGMACAGCHGLPGKPKGDLAAGMYPPPPQFFAGNGGHGGPAIGETYWKVANGVRLKGMPAFGGSMSETELWQVSEVIAHKNALPDAAKAALASPDAGSSK